MHLTAQVLQSLVEELRHAAGATDLLERTLRHLATLGSPLALFVHQDHAPHHVRAAAVRGFPADLPQQLAPRLRLGVGRVHDAWLEAPVPETAVSGTARLQGTREHVTLVCGTACAPETLSLVTTFLALAIDRGAAVEDARRLGDLFNAGPVVVFRWRNAEGWPVEYVSPNVTKEFGFEVESLVGKPYAPHVHPEDLARVGEEVHDALERGLSYFGQQYRVLDERGRARDIYDFTHVVRDASGAVTHFHCYVFDDSQRLEAEKHRAELRAQLQQSQKLQAVGTLASGIAHDFNNVLAAILAHLELARLDPAVGANADLSAATKAALRGRDIVRQLLVFGRARIEERQPWRLSQLIEEAMGMIRSSIPSSIGLRLGLDPRTPPVLADGTQLQQVLVNLVTNAAHAMPRGGVVEISVAPTTDTPPRAQLAVRDTGAGMAPEVVQRAFEPFFTTKPVGQGTGLGLAMVHSIVTAHGGTIRLDSTLGQGTTVTISLPPGGPPATAPAPEAVATTPGAQQRIALVEDEPLVARATERLLTHFGYRVTVHADAHSVLAVLTKDPGAYELVLTDQTMPGMTGLDLARGLRERGIGLPVLLVTGQPQLEADDVGPPFLVLSKPYRAEDLSAALTRLLEDGRKRP